MVTRLGLSVCRRVSWLMVFALTLSARTASGEERALTAQQTLQAERWGEQGVEAYHVGDYAKALELLGKGYDLSQWNTIGVWLAKTTERLDEPLEAYRIYVDVAASPVAADEPTPFARAREEARGAVDRLEAQLAVVELVAEANVMAINVRVNGEDRRLSKVGTLVVSPGTATLEVRWEGGSLPTQEYMLSAGQRQRVGLGSEQGSTSENASDVVTEQTLSFDMHQLQGWTLYDVAGKPICELPCKWTGIAVNGLSVRQGTRQLPVRVSRRHQSNEELLVFVNPSRGSKGWALGLGIPSALMFLGSVVALASEPDEPALAAVASLGFGAGTAACTWWFIWSKNHPYLTYDTPTARPAAQGATIGVGVYGNTLSLGGTF